MKLVPASLVHVGPLALNMRAIDRQECQAFGRTPKDALRLSLRTSLHALTAMEGKRVLAMFGVCPVGLLSGRGTPWFLGTDAVFDHARALMRVGSRIVGWWREEFDEMSNVVSVENEKAIRLLRYWGAKVDGETQMIGGIEFVAFRWSAIQG